MRADKDACLAAVTRNEISCSTSGAHESTQICLPSGSDTERDLLQYAEEPMRADNNAMQSHRQTSSQAGLSLELMKLCMSELVAGGTVVAVVPGTVAWSS